MSTATMRPQIIVDLLVLLSGLLILYFVWRKTGKTILKNVEYLKTLDERYLRLFSGDERTAIQRKRRKTKKVVVWITGTLATCIVLGLTVKAVVIRVTTPQIYEEAISLAETGAYEEAADMLSDLLLDTKKDDYLDAQAYIKLWNAHLCYDEGDITEALECIKGMDFLYLDSEELQTVNDFAYSVKVKYREKVAEERHAYYESLSKKVPYVGMNESDIGKTALGEPADIVRHEKVTISAISYMSNLYDFKLGSETIFTACCVQGVVTEVWDNRKTTTTSSTHKTSTKTYTFDDPYNVRFYSDAEDFYYDHYDDFWDYEEAEEYFNVYHG